MRRRYVTEEELEQIVRLKQGGASWLKIEKETGVPRRTARRAHEDWERTKSGEELRRARIVIAEEEFRAHMEELIALAQALVDSLDIPKPMDEILGVDQVLEKLWQKEIRIRSGQTTSGGERDQRRIIRQNKMLFQCLQEHTRDKLRWRAFEEWQQALGRYIENCRVLRSQAREVLGKMAGEQVELENRIQAESNVEKPFEEMAEVVVEVMWKRIRAGEKGERGREDLSPRTRPVDQGKIGVSAGEGPLHTTIRFGDKELAEEVAFLCRRVESDLMKPERLSLLDNIAADIGTMRERARELEDMLDDLLLRPIIIGTKCDLCPA